MQKLSNTGKVVTSAIVVAVIIVLAIVFFGGQNQNTTAGNDSNSGNAALTATSPNQTPAPATTTAGSNIAGGAKTDATPSGSGAQKTSATPSAPTPPTIHFITPVANDVWTIGAQNLISWDKAPNITGSISLIDATTNQSVGVILPEIGPNQTSYSWNTRDILLSRTNPLKKNVLPGTYMIVVAFDGNNLKPITSPSFTITN